MRTWAGWMDGVRIGGALLALALPLGAQAQERLVSIHDKLVIPENLTSGPDGTLYVGSYGKGGIYRAAKGSATATSWIAPGQIGRVMGLLVDARRGLLWTCVAGSRKTDMVQAVPGSIRALALATGKQRARYEFENGGLCNDLTVAPNGTVYASDMDGRILRLAKGDTQFKTWIRDAQLASVDGLAILDDGHLYVNTFRGNTLLRIAIGKDGSAGAITPITLDRPLASPDGMRRVGPAKMLLAEGVGRLTLLTITGDRATARTVKDGIADSPTGVTLVGNTAYVSQAKWAARSDPAQDNGVFTVLAVPYVEGKGSKE